jgi:hypothetical protein
MILNLGISKKKEFMKKVIDFLKTMSKGDIKGMSPFAILFVILVALGVIVAFPLTLVWGLQLMGLPVEASFSSWLGSVLILFYLTVRRSSSNGNK